MKDASQPWVVRISDKFGSDLPRTGPPVGLAFLLFTLAIMGITGLAFIEREAERPWSSPGSNELGIVAVTILTATAILCLHRAATTRSWIAAAISATILAPAALWTWPTLVTNSVGRPMLASRWLVVSIGLMAIVLLTRGLKETRWLETYNGLAAVGLVLAAGLVSRLGDEGTALGSVASLVVLSGSAGLYGLLVDIEVSGYQSEHQLVGEKLVLEHKIQETEEILHDLRNGLMSIEAAMGSIDSDFAQPVRTEAARLRALTAKPEPESPNEHGSESEFNLVPGMRGLVNSRAAAGIDIDLRSPDEVSVAGNESDVLAIVENLVSNAERHGKPPIDIHVDLTGEAPQVVVTDLGPSNGAAEGLTNNDDIFKRGYTTSKNGSGLGLSRAKELARRNNATLDWKTDPDSGTSFVLSFPPPNQ